MTLRRLVPITAALVLAGAVVAAAGARPSQSVTEAKRAAVVRPTAHSVDVLRMPVNWLAR